MAVFSALGAVDLIIGNRFGMGKEFEKGLMMLGNLALSMIGMITLAPLISHALIAPLKAFSDVIPIDPSAFIASLLANDMGGAQISQSIANSESVGYFNGLVVSSMMGATVSFTLPYIMGAVEKTYRKSILSGLMCGICTIPVGCFISGLLAGIPITALVLNLLPLIILSAIISVGLIKLPSASIKIFNAFGVAIRAIVILGLVIGISEYLTGYDIIPYTAPIEEGAGIILNIAVVMTGIFPLLFVVSKLLSRPLRALGRKAGMNEVGVLGFISTLATSVTTFGMVRDMDEKSTVLNSAFAVSAAFTFADHLAFTLSFKAEFLPYVIVGKLISGITAVALAALIYKRGQVSARRAEN